MNKKSEEQKEAFGSMARSIASIREIQSAYNSSGGRRTIEVHDARNASEDDHDFVVIDENMVSKEDFQIIEKLGSGSFGSVYAVTKKSFEKKGKNAKEKYYAMKVLDKDKILK